MVIITLTIINTFADEFVGENGLVAKIREYNYITVFKQFLCFILEIKRDVNPVYLFYLCLYQILTSFKKVAPVA